MPESSGSPVVLIGTAPGSHAQAGQSYKLAAIPRGDNNTSVLVTSGATGLFTDYEVVVEDVATGSPTLVFTLGASDPSVQIRRVIAEFEGTDPSNAFSVFIRRTIGGSPRDFTIFALSDTGASDYVAESNLIVRPGESVYVAYAGVSLSDLWAVITVEDA